MSSNEFYSRRVETRHIISGKRRTSRRVPTERYSRIIRREQVKLAPERRRFVGGDPGETGVDTAPAVILEQEGGRLVKILVTCPCGRHAELACEDED